uniref:Phosphatidylinositol glycan anchor biosynthesis class U protein-like n=1 Tax=Saccoglossus kowalevskii TaxID=10224 RepID=A0ABM0MH23_SACKO|nr:PREDICTED: phosphatidylinositol glycan anchor biosynthesis class U protein-like [Saccoglossus kowalevskii]
MAAPIIVIGLLAVGVRFLLLRSSVAEWLSNRVEIVTPITSWDGVTEGLSLFENGISPYSGDVFHETPLALLMFHYMKNISYDRQISMRKKIAKDANTILIKFSNLCEIPDQVAALYLLNPYTIATCVAKSTILLNNLAITIAILYTLKGNRAISTLAIAIATYQSLYPAMLIAPCAVFLAQKDKLDIDYKSPKIMVSIAKTICVFVVWLAWLLLLSYLMFSSADFLYSTYGFILSVPNLRPNMGVFWYFFTEMFEHFRVFFLFVFQINVFIYTVPLLVKLKNHPLLVMYLQCALIAIFKSYPSFGDTVIYLALLPVWSHVFTYLKNSLVVGVMYVVSSVLAFVVWHLWIYSGSANANFFFAMTLVYTTAQIFLVTDLLYAFLRHEYDLTHGVKQIGPDGKPLTILLE